MKPLLNVDHLHVSIQQGNEKYTVVSDVSFSVNEQEVVCIVGESGCGKSISCLSLLRLLPNSASIDTGKAIFKGNDLYGMSESELDKVRGNEIALISQDPLSSLDPLYKIGQQIDEAIVTHQNMTKAQAKQHTIELLLSVGLNDATTVYNSYPHTLSGGMRQRAMIAMALANHPKLLLADEPTTALDVTIQAQIMDLLRRKKQEVGMSILLITHDMGVVASLADRVYVMYSGQIVESGTCNEVLKHPKHPYTQALINAIPTLNTDKAVSLQAIEGNVPSIKDKPNGCAFAPRCKFADSMCVQRIELTDDNGHCYRCIKQISEKIQ